MGRYRLESENGQFFTKSDFESTIIVHICVLLGNYIVYLCINYIQSSYCICCVLLLVLLSIINL